MGAMLQRWYAELNGLALSHLPKIAAAFVATLLALYGADVTRWIRRYIRRWPFVARAVFFIALVGVGFGAAALALTSVLSRVLLAFDRPAVLPLILVLVVGLGLLAERRRQI